MLVKILLICLLLQSLIDKSYEKKKKHSKTEHKLPKDVQYQSMVSLQFESQGEKYKFCNGIILNPLWIITSAYCFDNIPPGVDVYVNAGVNDCFDYGKDSQYIKSVQHYIHPNYSGLNFDNNIAMLKLEKPLLYKSPNIRSPSLPSKYYEISSNGIISGWLKSCNINHNTSQNSSLISTNATLVTNLTECKSLVPGGKFNKASMLCVRADFSNVCSILDSGSPFIQYTNVSGDSVPIVVGLSSLSRCGGKPNIYTNIQYYLDFIKDITQGEYDDHERILQGHKVSRISQFPYMVPIINLNDDGDYDRVLCGGVLINNQWILTAGHCFGEIHPKHLRVRPGVRYIYDPDKTKPLLEVENYFIHPNFDIINGKSGSAPINDIALIKLVRPVKFSSAIQPIKMASENLIPYDTSVILGWGKNDVRGSFGSNYLLHAVTDIVDSRKCQPITGIELSHSQICVQGVSGTCHGDSGGPLIQIHNNIPYTFGIVSYGTPDCDSELPAAFTRVSSFRKFIDETIENN